MNSGNENMFSKEQLRELLKEVTSQEFSVLAEKHSKAYDELLKAYKQQQEVIAHLREQLAYFQSLLFGKKSEKIIATEDGARQLYFNFGDEMPAETEPKAEAEEIPTIEVKSYKRKTGRKPFSDDIPLVEEVLDLPDEMKHCACGHEMQVIGRETCDHLEYFPARRLIRRTVRLKYACRHCEGTATEGYAPTVRIMAAKDEIIPKSFATPSLLAYLLTSKFNDALPLYRLSNMMKREGIDLSRATMSNWILRIAPMLKPMMEVFKEELYNSPVIHSDETTFQVNKEPGKAASSKSYMWVLCSNNRGSPPTVLYNYRPTRAGEAASNLMKGYEGYLMTDGYSGYNFTDQNDSKVIHLACWAHARRKFHDVLKILPKEQVKDSIANQAITYIARIYDVEKTIRNASENGTPLSDEQIRALRSKEARPVLAELHAKLNEWCNEVPPKSKTGAAITYTLNLWDKLIRYLDDGRLPIDNNSAENAIRPFAVGRKNWLFSDTVEGAEATATMFSLIRTAVANNLEPYWYLRYLLDNLTKLKTKDNFRHFMPQNIDQAELLEYQRKTLAYENNLISQIKEK